MKSIILVLALCACASFAHDLEEYTWEGFKKIHKRTYVGEEEKFREIIFEDNLQRIADFNAEDHSYKMGVNQFSDMVSILCAILVSNIIVYIYMYVWHDKLYRQNCPQGFSDISLFHCGHEHGFLFSNIHT